ncbi:MAG: ABC transporter permease subunit [Proteobacteria bacterium]|nr:ABC transporter permease subunit [Pseudomonadota bacterium]
MNGLGPLLRKELAAIFWSPVAYAVIAMFIVLMSYTFCAQLFHSRSASSAPMLFQAASLLILTIPLLTMRQFAEERRNGTLELLLSTPIDDLAIVLAKFLATMSVIAVMLILLLAFPLVLGAFSTPDWGPIASGYTGLVLLAGALTSIGLAVSTVTSNQLVAAVLTLGLFLLLWMAEVLGVFFRSPVDEIAIAISLDTRFTPFATGAVYLSDFGFFLTIGLIGVLLSVAGLSRR